MFFTKKVLKSIAWLGALQYFGRILDFIKLAILTRVLSQADFGIFALSTATINTLETLSDTGFNFAFIHFQEDIRKYSKTIWIVTIIRGAILTLFSLLIAKVMSNFFNSQTLLLLLIPISFVPLLNGFKNPAIVEFQRKLDFHKEFIYKFIPDVIAFVVAIYLSLKLHSAISLVYAVLAQTIAELIISFVISKSYLNSSFNLSYAKKLFDYGKYITMGSVFAFLLTQLDNFFVGKFFGPTLLGVYDLVFKLSTVMFTEFTDLISQIAFPYFSQIKKDQGKLKEAFSHNMLLVALPAAACTLLLFIFPKEIISIIFGKKYIGGADVLRILSIYGFLRATVGPLGPLFLALGKQKITTISNIVNFFLLVLLIYPLSKIFGLEGTGYAVLLSYLISLPLLLPSFKKFKNTH